jgi:hypothetical protein
MFQLVMDLTIKSDRAASDCLAASLGLTLLLRDASAGGAWALSRSGRISSSLNELETSKGGPNELEKWRVRSFVVTTQYCLFQKPFSKCQWEGWEPNFTTHTKSVWKFCRRVRMSFCFSRVPSKLIGAKTYRELAHGAPFSIVFLFILRFSYQLIQLTSSVFITIALGSKHLQLQTACAVCTSPSFTSSEMRFRCWVPC